MLGRKLELCCAPRFPQHPAPSLPDPKLLGTTGADLQQAREVVSRSPHQAEPGSPAFQPHLVQLITAEARIAARAAEDLACRAQIAESRLPQLAGDSADQRRLLQRKQAAKGRAEQEVDRLRAWLVPDYVPAELLPEDVQLMRQAALVGPWDMSAIMQCRFPWHAASQELTSSRQLQLHRLHRQLLVARRSAEELALIEKEQSAAMLTWRQRAHQLRQAIMDSRARVMELGAQAAAASSSQQAAAAEGGSEGPSSSSGPAGGQQAASLQHEKAVLEGLLHVLKRRLRRLDSMRAAAALALAQPTVAAALVCVRHQAPAGVSEAEELVFDGDGGP